MLRYRWGSTWRLSLVLLLLFCGLMQLPGCVPPQPIPQTTRQIVGLVEVPEGLEDTLANAVAFSSTESVPVEDDGSFSLTAPLARPTVVGVELSNELFLLNISLPGSGASSVGHVSPQAAPQSIHCSIETTVQSLVFMNPSVFHSDPERARQIMSIIERNEAVRTAVDMLTEIAESESPLENAEFLAALNSAIRSVSEQLVTQRCVRPPERSDPLVHFPDQNLDVSVFPKDLEWVQCNSADIHLGAEGFVLRPRLWEYGILTVPTTWYVEVHELDPGRFDGLIDIGKLDGKSVVTWLPGGYQDEAVLAGETLLGWLDVGDRVTEWVFHQYTKEEAKEQESMLLPSDKAGIYLMVASSGGWGDRAELRFLSTVHASNVTDYGGSPGWRLWAKGLGINLTRIALKYIAVLSDVLDQEELVTKIAAKAMTQSVKAADRLVDPVEAVKYGLNEARKVAFKGGLKKVLGYIADHVLYVASLAANLGEAGEILGQLLGDTPLERAVIVIGEECLFDDEAPHITIEEIGTPSGDSITLGWSAVDDCSISSLAFRYYLEGPGQSAIWSDWKADSLMKTFDGLEEGDYRLHVEAKDDGGNVGSKDYAFTMRGGAGSATSPSLEGYWTGSGTLSLTMTVRDDRTGQQESETGSGQCILELNLEDISPDSISGEWRFSIPDPPEGYPEPTDLPMIPINSGSYVQNRIVITSQEEVSSETVTTEDGTFQVSWTASILLSLTLQGSQLVGTGEVAMDMKIRKPSTGDSATIRISGDFAGISMTKNKQTIRLCLAQSPQRAQVTPWWPLLYMRGGELLLPFQKQTAY